MLKISPPAGAPVALPRPVVTAITAELRIVMREPPRSFFEHTDLLDFPGARSRQPLSLGRYFAQNDNALKETLPARQGRLPVRPLRRRAGTHLDVALYRLRQSGGHHPAEHDRRVDPDYAWSNARRARQAALRVLPGADHVRHDVRREGGLDRRRSGQPFATRMEASLRGFFGKAHEWPREWTPAQPFTNCVWLRNPNFKAETIIEYEGALERAIRADKEAADPRAARRAASRCPRCGPTSTTPSARSTRRCG